MRVPMSFFLVSLILVPVARGADQGVTVEGIRESLKTRQVFFRNVWLKYRVHEFISKECLQRRAEPRPRGAPPREPRPYSDLRFTVDAEYIRKGDLARMVCNGPSVAEGRLKPSLGQVVHVYNGKRTIQVNGAGKYTLSFRPEAVNGYATPWHLCGEDLLLRTLEADRDNKIVITERKISPGPTPEVEQLDLVSDTKWRNKVWLLPKMGYSVRQFDVFNPVGSHLGRYHGIEYDTVDGVPYPVRATYSTYDRRGENAILYEESRLEVTSITTNRGDIPNSLFEVEIPKGADVYDRDQAKFIRNPERVQKVLDEIAHESPRARQSRLWIWFGAATAGILAGSLGWWVWRRRVKSSR